jgi:hypothetical protein
VVGMLAVCSRPYNVNLYLYVHVTNRIALHAAGLAVGRRIQVPLAQLRQPLRQLSLMQIARYNFDIAPL